MHAKPFYDTVEEVIGLWYKKMVISETACRLFLVYIFESHGIHIKNHSALDPAITTAINKYMQQADVEKNQVQ